MCLSNPAVAGSDVTTLKRESQWKSSVEKASHRRPVYVLFRTSWCPYCNKLEPIMKTVAKERHNQLSIVIVDTEEFQDIAQTYRVGAVPDVRVWIAGEEAGGFKGMQPKNEFEDIVDYVQGRWESQMGSSPK